MRVGVLADDLTGANAIAAIFTRGRNPVRVVIGLREAAQAAKTFDGMLTINLESRFLQARHALAQARQGATILKDAGVDLLFKQTDSALYGNIAVELQAAGQVFGARTIPFAPACPERGRYTIGGHHLTQEPGGLPRLLAYIPSLLHNQGAATRLVPLATVEAGPSELAQALAETNDPITVVDACQPQHLDALVEAAVRAGCPVLGGSVGLATALAQCLTRLHALEGFTPSDSPQPAPTGAALAPYLAALGSHSPVTMAQVRRAVADGACHLPIDLAEAITAGGQSHQIDALAETARQTLAGGTPVILASAPTPESVALFRQKAVELGRTQAEANTCITEFLGALVRTVLSQPVRIAGLLVGGGETAHGVLTVGLGATSFDVLAEVFPGCTLAIIRSGSCIGLPVITKAGGWGSDDGITLATQHLQQCGKEERAWTTQGRSLV